jgi:Ca2+-transporting ATPase
MLQPPRPPRQSILSGLAPGIALAGSVIAVTALLAGWLGSALGGDLRSSIFVTLGLGQLGVALALRTRRRTRDGRVGALWWAVAAAAVLQLAGVYVAPLNELLTTQPLPWSTVLVCVALALLPGVVVGVVRRVRHKSHHRRT